MIIAIDESGNFNKDSNKMNLFIAAQIFSEAKLLKTKKKQFENWEKNISKEKKDKNDEVKGQLLGKVELRSFLKNVIFQKPEIKFSIISIKPSENRNTIIKKHHDIEIEQLKYSKEIFQEANAKKRDINFFEQYVKWLNKRNESQYLKLMCLKRCIYESFVNTFINGMALNNTDELLSINFKIDNDFISNENKYWKLYLIRHLHEYTKKRGIPILDTWPKDHPVLKKYIRKGKFYLKNPFEDNLNFLDSKTNFEIRIADIAAIIVNRYFNSIGYKSLYQNIRKKISPKIGHHHLILNDFIFEETLEKFKNNNSG